MKIALFGGSFNPPHRGHIEVVKDLVRSDQFDEIWVIPAFKHPFDKELISYENRLEMCRLAFNSIDKKVKVREVEKEANSPKGYTIDLIHYLIKKYPKDSFSLVIGSDLFQEKNKWKNFDEIEKKVSLFKIARSGYEKSPYPNISSSKIRETILQGGDLKNLLPESLIELIEKKAFYR